ncbi:MAG: argininosuccinate synthase [Acidobacteria bacterium]|nr:argininosuccinate synthase [Acidobacteriota bacterium]
MRERIVLAYSGGLRTSAAVQWLAERYGAEVVTVTLDIGQSGDLELVRDRALELGAARAHVLDEREAFAREYALRALSADARGDHPVPSLAALARPLVAATLVAIAAIEQAPAVAHGSSTPGMDEAIARLAGNVRIVALTQEWARAGLDVDAYARAHGVSRGGPAAGAASARRHLLCRPVSDLSRAPDAAAHVDLTFERDVPVAMNGVPMSVTELIEILSLIAGRHGIGRWNEIEAPAAVALHAAYGALRRSDGHVRLSFFKGQHTVVAIDEGSPRLLAQA